MKRKYRKDAEPGGRINRKPALAAITRHGVTWRPYDKARGYQISVIDDLDDVLTFPMGRSVRMMPWKRKPVHAAEACPLRSAVLVRDGRLTEDGRLAVAEGRLKWDGASGQQAQVAA